MGLGVMNLRLATALKSPFSSARRAARMERFVSTMGIKGGERIIDLGGAAAFWSTSPVALNITLVNLPGSGFEHDSDPRHTFELVEADACDLHFVADNEFDIAVSNSVIEHVGPPDQQAALAREARRVAPRYWVQTPSIWFPIEAHSFMPFWWFYPPPARRFFIELWRKKTPARARMIETTTVLLRRDFQNLFPDGKIWTERYMGVAKSYVAYRS